MTSLPIILPENFVAKVTVGKKVTEGEIIAQKKQAPTGKILPIAKFLGTPPNKTLKFLKKKPGDRVEKGELLAEKNGVLNGKKLISAFSGTILRLEEDTGDLYIVTDEGEKQDEISIVSPVAGKVVFCDNTKIVIETDKNGIVSEKVSGENANGELFLIEGDEIDSSKLTEKISGKIVLGKKFDKTAVYKTLAMGAVGIICQEIEDADFNDYQEKKTKNPLFKVSKENFEKLVKTNGKPVVLEAEKKLIIL